MVVPSAIETSLRVSEIKADCSTCEHAAVSGGTHSRTLFLPLSLSQPALGSKQVDGYDVDSWVERGNLEMFAR